MDINWKKLATQAKLRSEVYALFMTVFRTEPSTSIIKALKSSPMTAIIADLGLDLGEAFYNMPEVILEETLILEFNRLFIGPGQHISAHESVFTEVDNNTGSLWGPQTVAVKKFIETAGLDYKPKYTGIPDHIGVELEFMHKLTALESKKWLQEERENAEYCLHLQQLFVKQHLFCWLAPFCDAVIAQAKLPFYQLMAELLKHYMQFEQQNMINDKSTACAVV